MKQRPTSEPLSIEDAVGEFYLFYSQQMRGAETSEATSSDSGSAEDMDATRYRFAERLMRSLCPGRDSCADPLCRRRRDCRHVIDLRRSARPEGRRPASAVALRRAIWMYCNHLLAKADAAERSAE